MKAIYGGNKGNMPLERFPGIEYKRTMGVRTIVTLKKDVEFTKAKDGYWRI